MNATFFQAVTTQLQRKRVWIPLVLVFAVGVYYVFFRTSTVTKNEYKTVIRKSLITSVQGSGSVSAKGQVSVTALSSGRVSSVAVVPGQKIKKGQVIARVDSRNQIISLQQAQNDLASAKLALQSSKTNLTLVQKAQDIAVKNSHRSLLNSGVAAVSVGDTTGNTPPVITGTYSCDTEGEYDVTSFPSNGGVSVRFTGMETGGAYVSDIPRPFGSCGLFISVPKGTTLAPNATWQIQIPNKLSSSYADSYNGYQSALQARDKALSDAQQTIDSNEVSLKKAETSLQSAQYALNDTAIVAPFDGQVGSIAVEVGQQVSSGTAVATMVTDGKVADVTLNEVDVSQVTVGQQVQLTFDAVNGLTLPGTVSQIDTVGTSTQNVVTFKVRIAFTQDDVRVKPGMSVTALVVTNQKDDIIVVPNGVIKTGKASKGAAGGTYVEIKDTTQAADVTKKIPVTVGISNDTESEITSGLSGGEQVLVRMIAVTKNTSMTTTASASSGSRSGSGSGGSGVGSGSKGGGFGGMGGGFGR